MIMQEAIEAHQSSFIFIVLHQKTSSASLREFNLILQTSFRFSLREIREI